MNVRDIEDDIPRNVYLFYDHLDALLKFFRRSTSNKILQLKTDKTFIEELFRHVIFYKAECEMLYERLFPYPSFTNEERVWIDRPAKRFHKSCVFFVMADQKTDMPSSRKIRKINAIAVECGSGARGPCPVHDAMPDLPMRVERETAQCKWHATKRARPRGRAEYQSPLKIARLYRK
jgi:hypothetical protein